VVVVLGLYLLTYVLAFAQRQVLSPDGSTARCPSPSSCLCTSSSPAPGVLWQLLLIPLVSLFIAAFVCHRSLAEDRPTPSHLTEYSC
jgi:hypothetical protein